MPASQHVLQNLWVFPVVSASSWFSTLLVLLIAWFVNGRPIYPGQSNPYVAFVSDIAAFSLRPVFIVGSFITAITFAFTIVLVHWARYSPCMYGLSNDKAWRKTVSGLAGLGGVVASGALIALAWYDTLAYHYIHRKLLLLCFAGLAGSAIATTIVWWSQGVGARFESAPGKTRHQGLRRWILSSNLIVLLDALLGIVFLVLMYTGHLRTAGVLEWVLTFIGCGYLFTFAGYLWLPREVFDKDAEGDGERRSLLRDAEQSQS